MARLNWQIEQENRPPLRGGTDIVPGACRVRVPLPGGALRRVRAQMHVNMEAGDRAFFNGYQSWTWCPELRREDRLSGIGPLPKAVIAYFGLRRYGDYAFASYRNKPGFFHGESYCYFRRGESFRLIASLDERMGYTVFSYDAGSHILDIERDCAGLFWPGGDFPAFELFFAEGPVEGGRRYEVRSTVRTPADGPLVLSEGSPVTLEAGADWIPLEGAVWIEPGPIHNVYQHNYLAPLA